MDRDNIVHYRGNRGRGFLACRTEGGSYVIHANIRGRVQVGPGGKTPCLPVTLHARRTMGPGAWQYE